MSNERGLAAAILAGGRAIRLGRIDKSGLIVAGSSILSRTIALLRDLTPHVFAVGDSYGAAARCGLPVVEDLVAGAGALGGIYTAIVSSPCDRTLVAGCDMPFLTGAFLEYLAAQRGADIVMPRSSHGYEPLCAIYGRGAAAAIRARLDRGERHAGVMPEGVQVKEVGPEELAAFDPDGLLFVNVNTPHDYARARRLADAPHRLN